MGQAWPAFWQAEVGFLDPLVSLSAEREDGRGSDRDIDGNDGAKRRRVEQQGEPEQEGRDGADGVDDGP